MDHTLQKTKNMKKFFTLLCAGVIMLSGCKDVVIEEGHYTYLLNEPVFMSTKAFRESVNITTKAEPISSWGKLCFYEGYLYISEVEKGIHIINNNDPSHPQNVGFIELMGNADITIHNGILYADSYIDLVWFNVDNPAKPELMGRLEEAFPNALPSTENIYGIAYDLCYGTNGSAREEGVIVGWNVKEHTATYSYTHDYSKEGVSALRYASSSSSGQSGKSGATGSMSRFALYEGYLYSVMNNYLNIIDLTGDNPVIAAENIHVGANVETIFSYKENMFMGTPTGLLIYSVANPLKPEYVRAIWHVFGCDPVVVEDDIAYVTIHSGNACGQTNNDLIIYDVSDVKDPKHIVTYAMKNPKGLGIDNGTLFLCDDGLKIFDASNPQTLIANRLAHYWGMDGYDVIPFDNILMMIADDGLYHYDYSDLKNIRQLSILPIVKK
jgi:hypothetical protein